jgi:curved DNA-binding protein
MARDYYEVLGVSRDVSADDLKRAFRKQAMKYHPDRNKNDPSAEKKFKELNEAYAVLSDPQKRKQYDQFGAEGFGQRFSQEDIFRGFNARQAYQEVDLGDLFGSLFGAFGGGGRRGGGGGAEFLGGFADLFGGGGGPRMGGGRTRRGPMGQPAPQPTEAQEMEIGLLEAVRGTERLVSLSMPGGPTQQISVKVPAGIEDGKRIRVRGAADGFGDLEFRVKLRDEAGFTREGRDLVLEKRLKLTDLLLGASLEVQAPDGTTHTLRIPGGTQPGTRVRMRGFGLGLKDQKGDLYVKVQAELPRNLSDDDKKLVEELKARGW